MRNNTTLGKIQQLIQTADLQCLFWKLNTMCLLILERKHSAIIACHPTVKHFRLHYNSYHCMS